MVLSLLQKIRGNNKVILAMLFVVFLSFSSVLSPEITQAQGTCQCGKPVGKPNECVIVKPNKCQPGFSPKCTHDTFWCSGCDCVQSVIDFETLEKITLNDTTLAGQNLSAPIQLALPYIFALSGSALLIFIIYAGYRMMLSQGDPKALAAARQTLIYGIVGLVLIFIAYWIVVVVGEFFGITPFNDVFIDS